MKFFQNAEDCLALSLPLSVGTMMCFLNEDLSENMKLAAGLFFITSASFLAKKAYDLVTEKEDALNHENRFDLS